jgi:sulfatase modifying factor 1
MITFHADRMMRSRPLRANVLRMHTREVARADMVAVPGGDFLMGSDAFYPEERPLHRVAVEAFWIDARPVTVGQFRRFITDMGSVTVATP